MKYFVRRTDTAVSHMILIAYFVLIILLVMVGVERTEYEIRLGCIVMGILSGLLTFGIKYMLNKAGIYIYNEYIISVGLTKKIINLEDIKAINIQRAYVMGGRCEDFIH